LCWIRLSINPWIEQTSRPESRIVLWLITCRRPENEAVPFHLPGVVAAVQQALINRLSWPSMRIRLPEA
jgi:hypothetical protein